ncbi:hypothetical protein I4U23_003019 [Adineta vaga]|nr:hypothetical protein I4U23_003019 [Adineta vaga]
MSNDISRAKQYRITQQSQLSNSGESQSQPISPAMNSTSNSTRQSDSSSICNMANLTDCLTQICCCLCIGACCSSFCSESPFCDNDDCCC